MSPETGIDSLPDLFDSDSPYGFIDAALNGHGARPGCKNRLYAFPEKLPVQGSWPSWYRRLQRLRFFDATSRTICAPIFSSGSLQFDLFRDCHTIFGNCRPAKLYYSRTTFRPRGPKVTLTASASWLTPRRIA